ncbi:hypothetical protein TBLA_0F02160 [Henningerozyma blattae CBS 6284]|uniref:Protein SCM3 n=1 Tax=Henningerozyma blattae (strain ATCC 34711 / CBS 6284 / DSM 70876 / NBRC 10599 / NRRL Y-10934 / UCD 77-7) TaxID=1071380 RepID=I2H5V6_HENB6|nr:hypothetical protein TBLA_0F02160 [Tetrapisispora blattae CBS 6284]CCH61758.1 hypothetical protein TBLA_0F02160 [Tetrapisispora blattae CBS 6284]
MSKKSVSKKKDANLVSLKLLHGAFKGLLNNKNNKTNIKGKNSISKTKKSKPSSVKKIIATRNGITYIKSKENKPIPKLSDDQVMERHKLADKNMKDTWLKIIDKYENLTDQGDLIDLKTGEIVENNGHVQNINQSDSNSSPMGLIYQNGSRDKNSNTKSGYNHSIRYNSTLMDIINIQEDKKYGDEYSIWQESGEEDEDDDGAVEVDENVDTDNDGDDGDELSMVSPTKSLSDT